MSRFGIYIVKIIFFLSLSLVIFQWTYNISYDLIIRSKIDWLQTEDTVSYDYVFIGSSRCIHHINPIQLDSFGVSSTNYGYASVGPRENLLLAKQVIRNRKLKTLVVQIDEQQNSQFDKLAHVPLLPHYELLGDYKDSLFSQYPMYRIPFFKYLLNAPKLGIRNIILGVTKKSAWIESKGFVPLEGHIDNNKFEIDSSSLTTKLAPEYLAIEKMCIANNVELIYFTAPILRSNRNFTFKFYSAKYLDFSDSLQNPSLFKDKTHLNRQGAAEFTKLIYNKLIVP